MSANFILESEYTPKGDQIEAIDRLVNNINEGVKFQTLKGATGTGKTFTIANVIKRVGKKTLVLAHNKTLAGQLYQELKALFPNNRVEYFISYYDYYQPEAYKVSSDTYIEKEATVNDEIDKMRNAATSALLEREDVIVVASVSCIYGIGSPELYLKERINISLGDSYKRKDFLRRLTDSFYERTTIDLTRGTYIVKGDQVTILPPYESKICYRISFDFDEIVSIEELDIVTFKPLRTLECLTLFPATQFVTDKATLALSIERIEEELKNQIEFFSSKGQFLEAERIKQRTLYDIEMLKEIGRCSGIENYSRHLALKDAGETPYTLLDYLGEDPLIVIDESHETIPQVRGMYNGDRSRKETLVNYGFRLPSALDNRPLNFTEFEERLKTVVFMSATPGDYEIEKGHIVEQVIRPSYLLDPIVKIRPIKGQIDDAVAEVDKTIKEGNRILITTLTIKMSEELTQFLKKLNYKVGYLHSEIKALDRMEIIRKLRSGEYDCLVGINLLREGLDMPEVSKVLILDADKEGFLRSERSLIQTIGRASRNSNGEVILYADHMTDSISKAVSETQRRRSIQEEYNRLHGTVPKTIVKPIGESLSIYKDVKDDSSVDVTKMSEKERDKLFKQIEKEMLKAAKELDFERAMNLRDALYELKEQINN